MRDFGVKTDEFLVLFLYLTQSQFFSCHFCKIDQNIDDLFTVFKRKGLTSFNNFYILYLKGLLKTVLTTFLLCTLPGSFLSLAGLT